MLSTSQRMKAAAIAAGGYPLLALLGRTLKWKVEGAGHWDDVIRAGQQPILALWHGRILAGLHYFRDRGIVVMTSQNFDGEYIARIIQAHGYGAARRSMPNGFQKGRRLASTRRATYCRWRSAILVRRLT